MLNRMTELATKASNGTYDDPVDRQAIQDEFNALNEEIDRIADSTNFNGIKLLDGTLNNASSVDINVGATGNSIHASVGAGAAAKTIQITNSADKAGGTILVDTTGGNIKVELGTGTTASSYTAKDIEDAIKNAVRKGIDDGSLSGAVAEGLLSIKLEGQTINYDANTAQQAVTGGTFGAAQEDANHNAIHSLTLQIGDTNDAYNQMNLAIANMKSTSLGVGNVKVDSLANAQGAMATIKTAINTVSTQRGQLGALQNRLEHTINNLGVTTENITAAESRIRDVDMAKEMMTFTKNSVLQQSAQAMLAQANQQPQSVLQLLQ